MPALLRHIDAIAREKKRDVIFLDFSQNNIKANDPQSRQAALHWLIEHEIPHEPCGLLADEHSIPDYDGQIYLDVPPDPDHPLLQKILSHFEYPDGSAKQPDTVIILLALSKALENKHHDEPGFWDRWAENF